MPFDFQSESEWKRVGERRVEERRGMISQMEGNRIITPIHPSERTAHETAKSFTIRPLPRKMPR